MTVDAIRDQLERVPRVDAAILQKMRMLESAFEHSLLASRLATRLLKGLGFSASEIAHRATQILLRDYHVSILQVAAVDPGRFEAQAGFAVGEIQSDRDEFRLSPKAVVRYGLRALVHSLYLVCVGMLGVILGRKRPARAALFFGAALDAYFQDDEKIAGFRHYCENGTVECLRVDPSRDEILIVQDTKAGVGRTALRSGPFVFSKDPLQQVVFETFWSISDAMWLVAATGRTLIAFFVLLFVQPWVALVARDIGRTPFVRSLMRKKQLRAIVLTNSAFNDQELWMNSGSGRVLESHMIWYSTNTRQFQYKDSRYFCDHPSMSYVKIDCAWVWNQPFADWVRATMSVKSIRVCGPILFRVSDGASDRQLVEAGAYDILIFDVTPVKREWFEKNYTANFYYYYQTDNVTAFLRDILEFQSSGRRLRIGLKHKRGHQGLHDESYISFVESCRQQGVEIIDPKADVFALIRRSRVSVAIPFSAPANAAAALGRPAVYYDPTGLLLPAAEMQADVKWVSSRADLHVALGVILGV